MISAGEAIAFDLAARRAEAEAVRAEAEAVRLAEERTHRFHVSDRSLRPRKREAIRLLWDALASTPGARCPDCLGIADRVAPRAGHAGCCGIAPLLR